MESIKDLLNQKVVSLEKVVRFGAAYDDICGRILEKTAGDAALPELMAELRIFELVIDMLGLPIEKRVVCAKQKPEDRA